MTRTHLKIPVYVICILAYASIAVGDLRSGPAENPMDWPDFGGTPDIVIPEDMGLSPDELQAILKRLGSPNLADRASANGDLQRYAPGSGTVIRNQLFTAPGASTAAMQHAIYLALRRSDKKVLLEGALRLDPTDTRNGKAIHAVTQIAAMLAATNNLETMAAYKTLLEFSSRAQGIFRYTIKKLLFSHKLDVLPALIYSTQSDDPELAQYAAKWIRDMGNPILSEQLAIKNPRRLAQLLEAHTSVKNLDAINVVLSMIDHQSSFVRTAARKCLEVYGKNIKWPVRRLYENTFSKDAPGSAATMQLLDQLISHFDNKRLSRMNALYKSGWAAYQSGDYPKMEESYKAILRHEPLFPKGDEMARGFLDLSDQLQDREKEAAAMENARLALRLATPDTSLAKRAKAAVTWIEAEQLRRANIVDPQVYRNILEDDPDHEKAQNMLERISGPEMTTGKLALKTLVVSLFVFLAASLTFLRLRG